MDDKRLAGVSVVAIATIGCGVLGAKLGHSLGVYWMIGFLAGAVAGFVSGATLVSASGLTK